jgi:hypothetical protein
MEGAIIVIARRRGVNVVERVGSSVGRTVWCAKW